MQIILQANETVLSLLKRFQKHSSDSRLLKYCVQTPVEEGVLLFNLLTREMVLLSREEYDHVLELDEMKQKWFVVPRQTNEQELAKFVRLVLTTRRKKSDAITTYTIFPTTDCNARCFYCYELGRSRIPMQHETALKVVQYIKNHCGGEKVNLTWFGGEPLYNMDAIETICAGLHREGIEFKSFMISNAYLFDEETVCKAAQNWNLKNIQITLDGTEAVYNRTKAYIYRQTNPYQIVLNNIERLLDASVRVRIRINMDLYNAENLLELIRELTERFAGRKNLSIYAWHIFQGNEPQAQRHSQEEWQKREAAMQRIEQAIQESGFASAGGLSPNIRLVNCMADSGQAVTILPDGNIGLCEHFSESEFVGHIDREGFDPDVVASWKERIPEIPECADCFCYPECTALKKCANNSICFEQHRNSLWRKTCRKMENEYRRYQSHTGQEETDDPDVC